MNGAQIRSTFLQYFESRGHAVVNSSPLIPRNDPTLFFANAGMVQFKNVFTGEDRRDYRRATTVQKCLRVSGKHNDLENVGFTPRHHTFFEMLGNFSFGDYFKKDAIAFAWDLLTNVFKLDGDKLWITVFRDDDEAFELWRDTQQIPERRIVRLGEKDNFWAMGDTGPCGPCSEIHIDKQAFAGQGANPLSILEDPEGYLEIWNLVFMQFERATDGNLLSLPRPSIDTGMGLERLASVLQGKTSNYDTDLFMPIIERVASLSGIPYGQQEHSTTSMRVIADHARATTFLICDGVMPSNEDRGYVLRRIMRRAIRHGVKLGLKVGFLEQAVSVVVDEMASAFPELAANRPYLREVVLAEEDAFARTLEKGLRLYREEAEQLKVQGQGVLSGAFAFKLSDTYGFPLDLTEVIASEEGLSVDHEGFHTELARQREQARRAWKGSGEEGIASIYQSLKAEGITTQFRGYEEDTVIGFAKAFVVNGQRVEEIQKGDEVEVIIDRTVFYAESGGQVADIGLIEGLGNGDHVAKIEISDTQSPVEGLVVHKGKVVAGRMEVGDSACLFVDKARRAATQRNHTATHLLHAALKEVLGAHVAQRGSLVAPDRLRFDFSHFRAMTQEELRAVEQKVNKAIQANIALEVRHISLQEALNTGVTALFGEKYGDEVRVVRIPDFSKELCGGTHVTATGDIGFFKFISEGGIQAGVRRVEAVTGMAVLDLLWSHDDRNQTLSEVLKVHIQEVPNRVQRLIQERKELEKDLKEARLAHARGGAVASPETRTREIAGVKVLSMRMDLDDIKALREEADRLRSTLGSGIVALGAAGGDKATLLIAVTKDLTSRFQAGALVKEASKIIDGSGGGKPELAQAGGKNPARLDEALDAIYALVASHAG
ncbi:MAG: alanine--tRNA ligase [Myxococcota bacterium]